MKYLVQFILMIMYFAGIAIAESMAAVIFAVIIPPFAIYITIASMLGLY